MPGDTQFEAKFAQMANTTLAERIPSLVEHSVGFQIIDKNDEDTKAAGVAAYAPAECPDALRAPWNI